MRDTDLNFVLNSWLKTFKYSGQSVKRVRDSLYYEFYEPLVKRLVAASDVYIACLRDDEDVVVGYLAIERRDDFDVIHFMAVKQPFQRMGVGHFLLRAAEPRQRTFFTHWTEPCNSLVNKFPFTFNPFLLHNR